MLWQPGNLIEKILLVRAEAYRGHNGDRGLRPNQNLKKGRDTPRSPRALCIA